MSDDLEVRFSMSRKRRGSYDVEYMRIVVGLIRDGIGAKSLARRCFASMFVRQVRQCFSVVWADGFPRCRHRFPVM